MKIRGKWMYLYRAVDGEGRTVDFRLSGKRDVGGAKAFLRNALEDPRLGTTDYHIGRLCGVASSGARDEDRRPVASEHQGTVIEISEQPDPT